MCGIRSMPQCRRACMGGHSADALPTLGMPAPFRPKHQKTFMHRCVKEIGKWKGEKAEITDKFPGDYDMGFLRLFNQRAPIGLDHGAFGMPASPADKDYPRRVELNAHWPVDHL